MRYVVCVLFAVAIGCSRGPKELSRIPYGEGWCILRDNGMVTIEGGGSKDTLPITLVSEELVEAFAKEIESRESR